MLTKCPECGKENVSDSAEACLGCGYAIKIHFDNIKKVEELKKQKQLAEEEKRNSEIKARQQAEQRVKNVPKPKKPVFSHGFIIYLIVVVVFFSWLMLYTPTTYFESPHVSDWLFELIVCAVIPLGIYYFLFYSKKVKMYNLAQSDFEAYQKQVIKEHDQAMASAQAQADANARELAGRPHCPYCNSQHTTKISITAKAFDTAMLGIYGEKRRYQWHCNNCKSNF